jgi:hypothetical protein
MARGGGGEVLVHEVIRDGGDRGTVSYPTLKKTN